MLLACELLTQSLSRVPINDACINWKQIKWAGNAKFVVEVGRIAFPMTITLSNIRFSGKLRAELGPLVPKVRNC
jgi:hypothetical protein